MRPGLRIEELPTSVPVLTSSKIRPLVTFPVDDDEDVVEQPPSEIQRIKQLILTTLFSRLKSIRQLLSLGGALSSSNALTESLSDVAPQLARCAATSNFASPLLPSLCGSAYAEEQQAALVAAIRDLQCLFWKNVESSISVQRLGQASVDTGPLDVCARLIQMSQLWDFEPNTERSEIRVDDKGVLQVGCQGLYYHEGAPVGPFRLYLALIKSLSSILTDEISEQHHWCVRALIWQCH